MIELESSFNNLDTKFTTCSRLSTYKSQDQVQPDKTPQVAHFHPLSVSSLPLAIALTLLMCAWMVSGSERNKTLVQPKIAIT